MKGKQTLTVPGFLLYIAACHNAPEPIEKGGNQKMPEKCCVGLACVNVQDGATLR